MTGQKYFYNFYAKYFRPVVTQAVVHLYYIGAQQLKVRLAKIKNLHYLF